MKNKFLRPIAVLVLCCFVVSCAAPPPKLIEEGPIVQASVHHSDLSGKCSIEVKHVLDRITGLIILSVLSPLFFLIASAIKIEGLFDSDARGPVFYKVIRVSEGQIFSLYKFRTMKRSALATLGSSDDLWSLQLDRKKNCTRVGRFLLKFYLDELPQIINIAQGEMSWIGPRPQPPYKHSQYLAKGWVSLKYLKGGITGPHQITKGTPRQSPVRSEEYLAKCEKYNVFQLLGYDAWIALMTVRKILKGEGL